MIPYVVCNLQYSLNIEKILYQVDIKRFSFCIIMYFASYML